MKSIVTGGCGFIGSHIVDRLLAEGHEVIVIDNCSTGRLENLSHHQGESCLTIVQSDICNYEKIAPLFEGVDWVFHMAALADIVPSIQRPQDYFHSNVDGTFSVLQASKAAGVKKFLYTASSSCYGIPEHFPTSETADIRPEYPYALTKRMGEELALHWAKVYRLPVISLCLFNVYGPRSRTSGTYGAVFGVFLGQKLAGKPFTVVGTGEQTRDFTYVTDVVEAFYTAAKSDVVGERFNVGSEHTYSVNRLVELLGGHEAEVVHIPKRPGEPDCTWADTSKINKMLGWRPRVSLEEGVGHILENIDYWKEAPVWTPASIKEATAEWFEFLSGENNDDDSNTRTLHDMVEMFRSKIIKRNKKLYDDIKESREMLCTEEYIKIQFSTNLLEDMKVLLNISEKFPFELHKVRYGNLLLRSMVEQIIEFKYLIKNPNMIKEYYGINIDIESFNDAKIDSLTPGECVKYYRKLIEYRYGNKKRKNVKDMAIDINEDKTLSETNRLSLYDLYIILSNEMHNAYFQADLYEVGKLESKEYDYNEELSYQKLWLNMMLDSFVDAYEKENDE